MYRFLPTLLWVAGAGIAVGALIASLVQYWT